MGLFSKPHYLGIDFGTASLKAVEFVVQDGKPALVNYAVADFGSIDQELKESTRSYDEVIGLYLQALLAKMKPNAPVAAIAMPAYTGLITLIELPEMNEKELQEAIQFEAHKYIPSSLDDVALSWEIVGRSGGSDDELGQRKMEVLLVAALNKEVYRYQGYVDQAKLKLSLLEIETFSLVRSLVGKEEGVKLVVDIGSRATNVILAENGAVKVSHNLDMGGKDITRVLAEAMDVTKDRAESLKRSTSNFLTQTESMIPFPALQMIGGEMKRVMEAYESRHSGKKVEEVVLSGGSARMTALPEYFANMLGVPVVLGDPWKNILVPPERAGEVAGLGATFSVAVGLALSGMEDPKKKDSNEPLSKTIKNIFTKKL